MLGYGVFLFFSRSCFGNFRFRPESFRCHIGFFRFGFRFGFGAFLTVKAAARVSARVIFFRNVSGGNVGGVSFVSAFRLCCLRLPGLREIFPVCGSAAGICII